MKNEKHTRQEIIDANLLLAGWNVLDKSLVIEEYSIHVTNTERVTEPSIPYRAKQQFSDYVLLGSNGKPLAVVEAKKTVVDAGVGQEQAKQYCLNIQKQKGGDLPFCFYTNGHDIFFWDIDNYPPRKIIGFPTRDDLERFLYLRKARKPLTDELINARIAGRDYQIQAIRTILENIEKRKRHLLLVMATGTGKTRTCIALVDALMRAGWVERVLFLVDRIALRDQALENFKEHLPNEPRWPKIGEKSISKDRRIYVSTYPTMLNIIRDEQSPLSPHFFDLIIVDESHRSIYNTYQEVLQYFNTLTLGLTATPTDIIDHNTFQIFDCEDGLPTFAYSYQDAINHIPPYLCDFQGIKIKTKFQDEGIHKGSVAVEDQYKLLHEGKDIEEINYEGSELEKRVTNRGTNALIIREFMETCIKDPNGVLPAKTIFFCISKAHARRMEEIFNAMYPEYKGELAKVLVSEDPRVYGKGGLLDQFTNNDMPRIAISVDMLDTGIDVRELCNLVFAKPVFSYTKFWQMIGRGTRLLEPQKKKAWCTEKDVFYIFDCWDNFDYFKLEPKGRELKPQLPLPIRLFGVRLDKIEKALEVGNVQIAVKEVEILRGDIAKLPSKSIVIKEAHAHLAIVQEDRFWQNLQGENIQFLRTHIKPLFRTVSGADYKAMQFEKEIVEVSLAHLSENEDQFDALKDSIIERISELPLSVNIVAQEEQIIRQSQTPQYWATFNDTKGDELIARLSALMRFIEIRSTNAGMEKFNLKDVLVEKSMIEFGSQHEALSVARYRELVEQRIQELLKENPLLQKIRDGETLSADEADMLTQQLYEERPHITLELMRRVYNNRKAQMEQFIKHILGIEVLESFPTVVAKAFDDFIGKHTYLTTRQLDFLNLLRDFIIEKQDLQKRDLIQSPFTMLHPEGIRGVFNPKEIEEIVTLTQYLVAA